MARGVKERVNELRSSINSAIVSADRYGTAQTAHTVTGRLEQANKWLLNPHIDDRGLGRKAITLIMQEGKKVMSCLSQNLKLFKNAILRHLIFKK